MSIDVDRNSSESLTSQIRMAIKCRIVEGILHPGTRLPSTRQLAADLGVSRSVAVEAYEQLTAEGYLDCQQGSGTRVANDPVARAGRAGLEPDLGCPDPSGGVTWDLRTGRADVTNFPRAEWLASYRAALAGAGREELDYPPVAGLPVLRRVLAGYLGRVRGARGVEETVMVTAGFAQGLALLCATLPQLGIRKLAIEDPGHAGQRRFIEQSGMNTVPVPVDEEGIDVDRLAASGARAVLVTPAHQFPTGYTMSPARREALIRWAERMDAVIIEDDYDGEFWFDRRERPPALQGLSPQHVIYAGTASKTLVPGMRLGWLMMPAHLSRLMSRVRARHDLGSDGITQRAFAELIEAGTLDRHLRRARSRYRSRREALAQAVRLHLPEAEMVGSAAGLHGYLRLPPGTDEAALVAAAQDRSALVYGAQRFQFRPGARPPGLVIGYSSLPLTGIGESMFVLGDALAEQARRPGVRSLGTLLADAAGPRERIAHRARLGSGV
ncbi:PLP-dependent aminotransferase family protein [Streptomyces sp. NBC_01190]|uniref:MocR-like pyridoxine biosynthesis transcription factor PdxR n=1 Tax=Streptomyces sp. NBC_01190 TaxID=2903767 RepID=UPI003863087F|nr:PLP-dependent aminotransferase family protein [Streptomyces sp. NBC_01190]